jgi:hypothetical protein
MYAELRAAGMRGAKEMTMDAMIVKVAVAGVVGAHGIGHALGWMPALGLARFEGVSGGGWLLSGGAGEGAARVMAVGLLALPIAGFVMAAVGLLLGQPWWRSVAVASSAASLAASALYPQAFPLSSTIGSTVLNVVILAAILVAGWGAGAAAA